MRPSFMLSTIRGSLQGYGAAVWIANLFDDAGQVTPGGIRSFKTFDELQLWLAALILQNAKNDFGVSFRAPLDATEAQIAALEILGHVERTKH